MKRRPTQTIGRVTADELRVLANAMGPDDRVVVTMPRDLVDYFLNYSRKPAEASDE